MGSRTVRALRVPWAWRGNHLPPAAAEVLSAVRNDDGEATAHPSNQRSAACVGREQRRPSPDPCGLPSGVRPHLGSSVAHAHARFASEALRCARRSDASFTTLATLCWGRAGGWEGGRVGEWMGALIRRIILSPLLSQGPPSRAASGISGAQAARGAVTSNSTNAVTAKAKAKPSEPAVAAVETPDNPALLPHDAPLSHKRTHPAPAYFPVPRELRTTRAAKRRRRERDSREGPEKCSHCTPRAGTAGLRRH